MVGGALALVGLLAAGCSGSSQSSLNTEAAGQLANGELPASAANGGHATTSVPLAGQNAITALFTAISAFQSCLQGLGATFIGAPDPSNPNSPTNDPTYIKNLTTCAVQSNILQALKAAQASQEHLTLSQIRTENKQYLKWRTCMIGKGWTIPPPKPNAQGLLFSFGGAGSGAGDGSGGSGSGGSGFGGIVPPAGKSILSTGDMETCATVATS